MTHSPEIHINPRCSLLVNSHRPCQIEVGRLVLRMGYVTFMLHLFSGSILRRLQATNAAAQFQVRCAGRIGLKKPSCCATGDGSKPFLYPFFVHIKIAGLKWM